MIFLQNHWIANAPSRQFKFLGQDIFFIEPIGLVDLAWTRSWQCFLKISLLLLNIYKHFYWFSFLKCGGDFFSRHPHQNTSKEKREKNMSYPNLCILRYVGFFLTNKFNVLVPKDWIPFVKTSFTWLLWKFGLVAPPKKGYCARTHHWKKSVNLFQLMEPMSWVFDQTFHWIRLRPIQSISRNVHLSVCRQTWKMSPSWMV